MPLGPGRCLSSDYRWRWRTACYSGRLSDEGRAQGKKLSLYRAESRELLLANELQWRLIDRTAMYIAHVRYAIRRMGVKFEGAHFAFNARQASNRSTTRS